MKKLTLLCACLFVIASSYAQAPFANILEVQSQMWNTSNVYHNTPTSNNLGVQLDTSTNATALMLVTSGLATGVVNTDTFLPRVLYGTGAISFYIVGLKCTGSNDTATLTPMQSLDGVRWAQVPGTTALRIGLGSLTVPVVSCFNLTKKQGLYYAVQIVGSSSSTMSWQCYFYYQKDVIYYK